MKRKIKISAIAVLVIVGLLITSAAAIPTTTLSKGNENNPQKKDNIDFAEITELIKDTEFQESLKKIDVKQNTEISSTYDEAEMHSKLVSMDTESNYLPMARSESGTGKQLIKSYATHPALGDADDGNLLLGFDWYYLNLTPPTEEIDAVIWQGHNDYGNDPEQWCGGIYWIYTDTEEPIPYDYPSVDYWGLSSIEIENQWFATMIEPDNPETPGQESGHINIMRVVGDPCDNESYFMRTWDFSTHSFHDMIIDDMSCSDGLEFPYNKTSDPFGLSSYVMSNEYADPVIDAPHVFYPIEYQGSNAYGLINWFYDSDNCAATSCYMDDETKAGFAIWDPYTEDQGKIIVWYGNDMNLGYNYPDQPGFDSGGWTHWLVDPNLDLKHPVIAANNGAVVAATEVHNKTNPNEVMLAFWYDNTSSGDVGENFIISSIWYVDIPGGGKIRYPEISHVQGHTFICTALIEDNLTFAVSYDAGETWDGFYILTEEYLPVKEYRTADISDKGSMIIWEHEVDPDNTMLIYTWATATFNGYCSYPGKTPAEDVKVEITNMDTGHILSPVYTDETGYYEKKLVIGLDAYIDVILRYFARDDSFNENLTEYQWSEMSSDVHTYSLDLVLEEAIPGDANKDGVVDIDDIFYVLGYWNNPGGPADVNNDGTVNIDDIFFILSNWT